MTSDEVKGKAQAGAVWCKNATDRAHTTGAKPWKYLRVPHDAVTADKRMKDDRVSVVPSSMALQAMP